MKKVSKKLRKPLLIWIYGSADTGKTGVIKALASRLRPLCSKFVEHRLGLSEVSDEIVFCQLFNYRIAMSSVGDSIKQVAENINKFSRLHVDVIVLVARKRFDQWNIKAKMQSALDENAKKWLVNCEIVEIPKIIQGWKEENRIKNTILMSCSSEDLFLFLMRILKHGVSFNFKNKGKQLCSYCEISSYDLSV